MPKQIFNCAKCYYTTNHKVKYNRHLETTKHKIAIDGIICCGLTYFDKHKWTNHKKSIKHREGKI